MKEKEQVIENIKEIDRYIVSLRTMEKDDIIENANAAIGDMMQKKRTLTKEYVDKVHPGIIGETKKNGKYPCAYVGKKCISAGSIDKLYEKLFIIYTEGNIIRDMTFKTLFEEALEEKEMEVSASTIERTRIDYNAFISDELASKDIKDVTTVFLKEYTKDLMKNKQLIQSAFKKYKHILNMTFEQAVNRGILEYNRAITIKFADYRMLAKKEYPSTKNKIMTPEQIRDMSEEVNRRIADNEKKGKCYTYGFMFLFATLTGMREGEICALKWEDVKFEDGYIHIHAQQIRNRKTNNYNTIPSTKNEHGESEGGREFPIYDKLEALLYHLKECQQKANLHSEWLFCNDESNFIKADTCYAHGLNRLCMSMGYTVKNNHAIRKYFNTYVLIESGLSVRDRAAILGHSENVNVKHYSFKTRSSRERAKVCLNQFFEVPTGAYGNVINFTERRKCRNPQNKAF